MKRDEIINILKKHKVEPIEITEGTNSYNSNVYIVKTKRKQYVFKIYKNRDKRLNEKRYYNYLFRFIPTSKVLHTGSYNNYEYNIISYFDGKNIYDEECNSLNEQEIFNIGKSLSAIHNCRLVYKKIDWIKYLVSCIDKTEVQLCSLFGKEDNQMIVKFLRSYIDKKIVNNYKDCLVHMDFRVGNVIIDNENRIGVIDFESMKNGDYVFDFVKMNRIFNKDNFNVFLNGYRSNRKVESDFQDKLKFYSFFDSYTSLYWCYMNDQMDSVFYKLNYSIVVKCLGEIKDERWII